MERLECIIDRVTYSNPLDGYSVLRCTSKGFPDNITIVGYVPNASVGAVYDIEGQWFNDKKYGLQFKCKSCKSKMPATAYAMERYLGGGMIKGIGKVNAKRIVDAFGENSFDVIENSPEDLLSIKGIGKKLTQKIKQGWEEQKEIRNVMMYLQEHDISMMFATKIYKTYGDQSINQINTNPYQLSEDIWGIGFKTADGLAEKLGFSKDCFVRLQAGIIYTLNRATDDGHCFLTKEQLYKKASEILECEKHHIVMTLDEMIHSQKVIKDDESIYIPSMFYAEIGIASRLSKRKNDNIKKIKDKEALKKWLKNKTGIEYDEIQVDGIVEAVQNMTTVLTGGPGTGKTTTVCGIIKVYEAMGKDILLAAPTGRAAKRMTESTGKKASTIHRLLGAKPPNNYEHNENNKLKGDVLIVDESSMIDLTLMNNLLKAVPGDMTLILVGDIDQLPSVGPGNILRDIIQSGCFPVIQLTKIFRQAAKSRIITNAHKINKGKMPDLSNGENTDFFFMKVEEKEDIARTIKQLISKNLPAYTGLKSSEIQVLSPMQRGEIGTVNLNVEIQNDINPGKSTIGNGRYSFRPGDKVIQLKNNYDKNIFNGDMGYVKSIDMDNMEITVTYDGIDVLYEKDELSELALAYALTIHKSQGSEYPVVVMPVSTSHYVMLQRNLLYTGITRAKKMIVLVGTERAINMCVRNQSVRKRNTKLSERIQHFISIPSQTPSNGL